MSKRPMSGYWIANNCDFCNGNKTNRMADKQTIEQPEGRALRAEITLGIDSSRDSSSSVDSLCGYGCRGQTRASSWACWYTL